MTLAVAIVATTATTKAQQMQLPPVPVDPNVRIGQLDNGLKYYIRHNEYPKDQANFYIAQRVGSMQEEDSQRGLAHFLEHMAFNGSEHFKDNGIIEYTRTLGVEFGRNLNAYTSFDQTVYNICNVPTTRQTALDSCLLILKDWSNGLLLEDTEIDKERGVIHQEWQMHASPGQRFYEKYLPQLTSESKYGYRLPIGLMSVVDNFKYQELRDYYHKWYRPDNQAIIVVGNIDVDHTEAEIKKLWSGVKVAPDAAKVEEYPINDNEQPIYITYQDKEQPYSIIQMSMKHDPTPKEIKGTVAYLMQDYIVDIVNMMLNQRLEELSQEPEAPFTAAQTSYGDFLGKTKEAFEAIVLPKEGKDKEALKALTVELERARQFGFTATEYERAKSEYLSQIEKVYTNRDKQENSYYYKQYVANYLSDEPIPSLEDYYQIMNMVVPSLPVEAINQYAKELIREGGKNLVVYELEQLKDGKTYMTPEALAEAVNAARQEKIEAYVDNTKDEPLISQMPTAGTIKSESEAKFGYKKLTLSNGIDVYLRKTDFKDDQVIMRAFAKGGKAMYGESDFSSLKLYDYGMMTSGLGNFSNNDLQKALAGKQASASISMGMQNSLATGSSTPKDLETMMQLLYLNFTAKAKDEKAYKSLITQLETVLKNKNLRPESVFSDSVAVTVNQHNPRFMPLSLDDIKNSSYDRMLEIAKKQCENAANYTFIFTGNFDEEQLKSLICQYIASLPAKASKDNDITKQVLTYAKGENKCHFKKKMETPKSNISNYWFSDKTEYSLKNELYVNAIGDILTMTYLRSIREDNGAAYSVGAGGDLSVDDNVAYNVITASCPVDPDKAETAQKLINDGLKEATTNINPEDLQKVKESMIKDFNAAQRKNGYWSNVLQEYLRYGIDTNTDYKSIIESMTTQGLQDYLKDILKSGNHTEIIMMPE